MNAQKQIVVNKNEEVLIPIVWLGKEKSILYDIHLATEGARVKVLGVFLGFGNNSVDVRINIYHDSPQTASQFFLRGVLEDASSVNFDGLVKINKGSRGSNAWLGAYLLLLSDLTKGRAVPSLEIAENDIKAGHATTVGKINELELFYLMSRGIPYEKSKHLLVEGFLKEIIEQLPQKNQKYIKERMLTYAEETEK